METAIEGKAFAPSSGEAPLLSIEDLQVSFYTYAGEVHAVRGVSYSVKKGSSLAVVGESGCGKTVTVQSVMRLIPLLLAGSRAAGLSSKAKTSLPFPKRKCSRYGARR